MARSGTKSSATSRTAKSSRRSPSARGSVGSSRPAGPHVKSDENFTIVSRDDRRRGETDWAAVDALSDEEIERAIRSDPDAVPLDIDWSKAVVVIPPKKKAISIRIDEDVLNYFKKQGSGYQRRMNAVLRFYVEQKRRRRA
jgi:uncharacterized protein (DUF4415 family)